jgi:hypothetical protein
MQIFFKYFLLVPALRGVTQMCTCVSDDLAAHKKEGPRKIFLINKIKTLLFILLHYIYYKLNLYEKKIK